MDTLIRYELANAVYAQRQAAIVAYRQAPLMAARLYAYVMPTYNRLLWK